MKKIILGMSAIMAFSLSANEGKQKAVEGKSLTIEDVQLINSPSPVNVENDDFASIRRRQYGNNTKEFYYFSRWHKYLEEVAEENARKAAYDKEVEKYNKEVARINAENQRIREYNESLSEGNAVDVSSLNSENVADSKKD